MKWHEAISVTLAIFASLCGLGFAASLVVVGCDMIDGTRAERRALIAAGVVLVAGLIATFFAVATS